MPNSSIHILDRHQVGPLIVEPLALESVALRVTTLVSTNSHDYRFPRIVSDPSATWLTEGQEIATSEMTVDEVLVVPRKIGGLSIISSELADDASPEAAATVGAGLTRDVAKKLDSAFFGAKPANGSPQPPGLESLTGHQIIAAAPDGIDPFIDALGAVEGQGATVDAWVTNPATAASIAKLTVSAGSRQPLLGDAASGVQRQVLGVPLLVSAAVLPGVVWGIPKARTFTVLRKDVEIVVDRSRFMTSDQVAVRAILRAAFGLPHAAAVVRIAAGG